MIPTRLREETRLRSNSFQPSATSSFSLTQHGTSPVISPSSPPIYHQPVINNNPTRHRKELSQTSFNTTTSSGMHTVERESSGGAGSLMPLLDSPVGIGSSPASSSARDKKNNANVNDSDDSDMEEEDDDDEDDDEEEDEEEEGNDNNDGFHSPAMQPLLETNGGMDVGGDYHHHTDDDSPATGRGEEMDQDEQEKVSSVDGDDGGGGGGAGGKDQRSHTASKTIPAKILQLKLWAKQSYQRQFPSSNVAKRTTVRVQVKKKETPELTRVTLAQRLGGVHVGPIWTMEFAPNGLLMATGGKDGRVVLWESAANSENGGSSGPTIIAPDTQQQDSIAGVVVTGPVVINPKPKRIWRGHAGDVSSLAWSFTSVFLVSASTDRTARVWCVSEPHCLCVFRHPDFVTGVDFHPNEEGIFVSGCLDAKLRCWDIPSSVCKHRVHTSSMITTVRFNLTGDFVVAGLYTGHCAFYQINSMSMRYYTQVECRNKAGTQKKGRKVTSIRFAAIAVEVKTTTGGDDNNVAAAPKYRIQEHMVVSTNDSRTRLYNMDDFSLVCKFRGARTTSMMPIGSVCSPDGRHILSGSDDRGTVVLWRLVNDLVKSAMFGHGKRELCETFEMFTATSSQACTVVAFPPVSFMNRVRLGASSSAAAAAIMEGEGGEGEHEHVVVSGGNSLMSKAGLPGAVLVVAGFDGVIGVFVNG